METWYIGVVYKYPGMGKGRFLFGVVFWVGGDRGVLGWIGIG